MTDREIVRYINNLLKERKISLESVANYYSTNGSNFNSAPLLLVKYFSLLWVVVLVLGVGYAASHYSRVLA